MSGITLLRLDFRKQPDSTLQVKFLHIGQEFCHKGHDDNTKGTMVSLVSFVSLVFFGSGLSGLGSLKLYRLTGASMITIKLQLGYRLTDSAKII